ILDELRRLADPGPTPDELARSRRRLESAWRWERDDPVALASGLGHAALWGDWRSWLAGPGAAPARPGRDIRRVAASYLVEENLTCGWTWPRADEAGSAGIPAITPDISAGSPSAPRVGSGAESSGVAALPLATTAVAAVLPGGSMRLA